MATIVLSAAGAAVGGSVGGTLAGLSSVAIGRAVGATLGRVVDQKLLGSGAQAVETGKVDRFRLTNAGEGDPVAQLYGRMRIGGQVIWASDFLETTSVTGGGKGSPAGPKTTEFSYSVNVAIALCEGKITRVGRIWADGEEVARGDLNMRVYVGSRNQLPDPMMEAIEGAGQVPAYRGTAYVVMENLDLGRFGNRLPQFSFEVMRPARPGSQDAVGTPSFSVSGVALIPGTGEYSLATTPVNYADPDDPDVSWSANVTTPSGKTDFATSLENMTEELHALESASLVVSWFGSDLRCGQCTIQPKVEDAVIEGENMPWEVAGVTRDAAAVIVKDQDRPIYGGTPTDQSVIEAIHAMRDAGQAVMFYPFILMDQVEGNNLPDPYSDAATQPKLPWRGRITLSKAPGQVASPEGTAQAAAEVDAFFGTVTAADFTVAEGVVTYAGPPEWSMSRFILHYAALCAAAGGVEAFCIGSEMRGLTQIRSAGHVFPAVARLQALAAEVRTLVGSETKLSYAADWSEYFGYQPADGSGDRFFHLDPLWADTNIDFIGIDNYMPLSDWRSEKGHVDGQIWDAIYNLDYLKSNIEGGEGYDWYYPSDEARAAQNRSVIEDGAFDEPWVFRYKDLRGWWMNAHHERIDGQRQEDPTDWVPQSKPFWFTEYGCGAVDNGTNQPNKFVDLKSSESALPRYSTGQRDDLIQMQYLRAINDHWSNPANNPVSEEYAAPMLDMGRAFVWAWDVRPFPSFPNNRALWSDGDNYGRGHWLNGRSTNRTLADVVREICERSGLTAIDTASLYGTVRGYEVPHVNDGRSALQPLMLRFGFDAIERDGTLVMRMRDGLAPTDIDTDQLVASSEIDGVLQQVRESEAEIAGRVRLRFVQSDGDFDIISEEGVLADEGTHAVAASEVNLSLTRAEGRQVVERWLVEARVARETARFALPPSQLPLGAGDIVTLPPEQDEGPARYRIDRVEQGAFQIIDAVRIEPQVYQPALLDDELAGLRPFSSPAPVVPIFLDLPLLRGDEVPHAPYIAATARPWLGTVALYRSQTDSNYALSGTVEKRSIVGRTLTGLPSAAPGLFDHGPTLEVKLTSGTLESVGKDSLFGGANLAAIGDGTPGNWEVFQFAEAELIAHRTYALRVRLRGQAGSDGLMPDVWPIGSRFVLLNGLPEQVELSPNMRGLALNYRIGPAKRPNDDPSYRHLLRTFDGNGLRPYAPCHLRYAKTASALKFDWIRRTRISGDSWDAIEVPLGEESENYLVRVLSEATTVREEIVNHPSWSYSDTAREADGVTGAFEVQVSQISSIYGAGLAEAVAVSA